LEGFPLLSRPILACAGVLAALVLAAGPAVAATPSTATTAPPTTAKPVDATCAALTEQQAIAIKRGAKPTVVVGKSGTPDCRALLIKERGLPFPKGAPETGGGGMAAEVSSWH
jgi:hypothetical protein